MATVEFAGSEPKRRSRLPSINSIRYHGAMTRNAATPETVSAETMVPIIAEHIAVKPGFCGGKPHIIGHRIKVQHIAVWRERRGMTPEEIVVTHPSLSLPE